MYVLLALVAACALGIAVHFLLGGRELRGVVLTPAVATVVTGVVYTGMQWAGVGEGNPLLWLVSIGGGIVATIAATLAVTALRGRGDSAAKTALGI